MINIGIKNRITYSFLLLVITSLTLLGFYLLHYFYTQNLENKTQHLITNAKIIELTLEQDLYNQDKRSYIETEIRRISNTVNPVSYTHLDVYKRQDLHLIISNSNITNTSYS